jgi:hypothetical protein
MVDHDPKLSRELRRLPAPRAGEGFTRAVMARLDTEPPAVPWLTLPRLAMVATAVVAVAVALSPTFREPFPGGGGAVPPTVAGDAAGPAGLEGSAAAAEPESTPPGRSALDEASVEPGARRGAEPGDAAAGGGAPPSGSSSGAGERGDDGRSGAAGNRSYRPDRRVVRVTERPGGETPATEAPSAAQAAGEARPGTARSAAFDPAAFDPAALDAVEREQALRRLAELRREQRQLDRRLTALAALVAPESAPALLLGGDESVELVLDLTAAAPTAGDMRPASYRPGGPPGRL